MGCLPCCLFFRIFMNIWATKASPFIAGMPQAPSLKGKSTRVSRPSTVVENATGCSTDVWKSLTSLTATVSAPPTSACATASTIIHSTYCPTEAIKRAQRIRLRPQYACEARLSVITKLEWLDSVLWAVLIHKCLFFLLFTSFLKTIRDGFDESAANKTMQLDLNSC